MAKNERTSKKDPSTAGKGLRNPKPSKWEKITAASTPKQRPDQKKK